MSNNGADMAQKPVTIPEIKRFLELWTSGPGFRDAVAREPATTLLQYGLAHLDPEELRPLYDPVMVGQAESPVSPLVQAYRENIAEKLAWRERVRQECAPENERLRLWRERQVARCQMELGAELDAAIIHTPLAVELALGCTVQCWFCSLDAPPFQEAFLYSREHAELWRAVLVALRDEVGPAARWGCLYWATEPLDNPDYEKFCTDFADIFGVFPQTTTAAPVRDAARTRALLSLSREKGCFINRFSVLSLPIFERIIATFTAAELEGTELLHQSNDAESVKAESGRSMRRFAEHPEDLARERTKIQVKFNAIAAAKGEQAPSSENLPMPGTTSCVSGFWVNMVQRRVQLISPCYASERWPLGLMVFAERSFSDAAGFRTALQEMIEQHALISLPIDRPVRLAPSLQHQEVEDGFFLLGRYHRYECRNSAAAAYLQRIGQLLAEGCHQPGAISIMCNYQFNIADTQTMALLTGLFNKGLLDEGV